VSPSGTDTAGGPALRQRRLERLESTLEQAEDWLGSGDGAAKRADTCDWRVSVLRTNSRQWKT